MGFQLVVGLVVVALYCCILDRSVHALDLAIGPRVADLGEPVLNALSLANTVKGHFPIAFGSFPFGKLNEKIVRFKIVRFI